MKKLFTILAIMIVLVGAVFADNGDKLNLVSDVAKILPVIKIKATNSSSTEVVGAATAADVATGKDIAEENIVWTFTIYQDNTANSKTYARYNKPVEISLTLGSFTGETTKIEANDSPVVTSVAPGTAATKLALAKDQTEKKLVATYTGKVDNQVLGTFTCTWTKDETLPDDTYKALVTLNYTVQ